MEDLFSIEDFVRYRGSPENPPYTGTGGMSLSW